MNKLTSRLLEQHFDTAFAAPDGIKKLRELILTLAMQGKLVEQYPNDPPASLHFQNCSIYDRLRRTDACADTIFHRATISTPDVT